MANGTLEDAIDQATKSWEASQAFERALELGERLASFAPGDTVLVEYSGEKAIGVLREIVRSSVFSFRVGFPMGSPFGKTCWFRPSEVSRPTPNRPGSGPSPTAPATLAEYGRRTFVSSARRGLHTPRAPSVLETIAKAHCELSEAAEAWMLRDESADLDAFGAELADVVLFCAYLADRTGVDLDAAVAKKADYNDRRPASGKRV